MIIIMKVLFVTHYSLLLGANRSMESLVGYLLEQGEEVEVLFPSKGKMYERLNTQGVRVHSFPFFFQIMYVKRELKYLSLPILWLYNLIALPFLLYKISKINPDVIYSNCSVDAYSIWISKILGKKHIVHIREFMREDYGARFLFGDKAKRWYLNKSDKIIVISNALVNRVLGELPKQGKVIYNGLRIPDKISPYVKDKKQIRLGVVGTFDRAKQQDLAIRFMPLIKERFPQVTLHLVGDRNCPYKKLLEKMVKELNLEQDVVFEGFIDDIEEIYKKIDVLLMCSRNEGFGRVTIEAMLRNVPVIGFDAGGTPELIEPYISGFLFHNCDEVIDALDFIVNKPEETSRMVENANQIARERFCESKYTSNVYQFIKDLLGKCSD